MSFETGTNLYPRHVGRYTDALAEALLDRIGVAGTDRALDVGRGPGAGLAALARVRGWHGAGCPAPASSSRPGGSPVRGRAGIGPSGAYCASLPPGRREALRQACFRHLGRPEGPFELSARAWVVVGRAG